MSAPAHCGAEPVDNLRNGSMNEPTRSRWKVEKIPDEIPGTRTAVPRATDPTISAKTAPSGTRSPSPPRQRPSSTASNRADRGIGSNLAHRDRADPPDERHAGNPAEECSAETNAVCWSIRSMTRLAASLVISSKVVKAIITPWTCLPRRRQVDDTRDNSRCEEHINDPSIQPASEGSCRSPQTPIAATSHDEKVFRIVGVPEAEFHHERPLLERPAGRPTREAVGHPHPTHGLKRASATRRDMHSPLRGT